MVRGFGVVRGFGQKLVREITREMLQNPLDRTAKTGGLAQLRQTALGEAAHR